MLLNIKLERKVKVKHFAKLIIFTVTMLLSSISFAAYSQLDSTHVGSNQKQSYSLSDPLVKEAVKVWIKKNSCGTANNVDQMLDLITVNSQQKNLDPFLVIGLIRQESCFNTKARSGAGALGYMQVIPKWHPEKVKGRSLYNPTVGIEVGTQVMREYINKHGESKGLRVYSGGARNYYNGVLKFKNSLVAYTKVYVNSRQLTHELPKTYTDDSTTYTDAIGSIIVKNNIRNRNSILVTMNN